METPEFVHRLHVNEMCRHHNYITWPSCFGAEADGSADTLRCPRVYDPNRVNLAQPLSLQTVHYKPQTVTLLP